MEIFGTFLSETIVGTRGNDTILGGGDRDTLLGRAGNDVLRGGDGDDFLSGQKGNDFLDGDAGNDLLRGNAGNDTLSSTSGFDTLVGGTGNDEFRFNPGKGLVTVQDRSFNPQEGDSAEDLEGGGIDTIVISLSLEDLFGSGNGLGANGAFGAPDSSAIFSLIESSFLDDDTAMLSFDNLTGSNSDASSGESGMIIKGFSDIEFLQIDIGGLFEITIPLGDIL